MAHIPGGEFPDDEITDITYMLESNDSFDELLADLKNEDDDEGTKVRLGGRIYLLANIFKAVEGLRASAGDVYPVDAPVESLLRYLR